MSGKNPPEVAVIISANVEWRAVRALFPAAQVHPYPYGEWFFVDAPRAGGGKPFRARFIHGGWGKISAAASAQYALDRWVPDLLINLGTCGGFEGEIERGTILLVERTIVYDIFEQMGDFDEHIAHYTTQIDLSWLKEPYPQAVTRSLLVSGDRDLIASEIPELKARYHAVAGDWESGAIAFVAARNGVRCLILRGVTDLVGAGGGEAYDGTLQLFTERTGEMMKSLVEGLGGWIEEGISER
jgi:adenosylhomocysteine nucleosidase